MSVYTRPDSPYFWLLLERPGQRPLRESTTLRCRGLTPAQHRANRQLADELYLARKATLLRQHYGLEPTARATITVADYLAWYQTHISAAKRGAAREADILATLTAAFGDLPLTDVTRERVQEWMTQRRAEVAVSTVNRELDVLKHALAQAVPTYLPASPLVGMRRLHVPGSEPRLLSRAEERRLLTVLSPADRAIVIMALDTLMRLSDVVNVTRAHDHGAYLTVVDPKVRQYRVPVSRRLRTALDALPNTGPYYFAHRRVAKNARDYRSAIRSMFRRACAKAEIRYGRPDGLTFHSLRHTGATRMIEAGVSLRTVQAIGGWSSLRQLERYTHPSDRASKAAVERVSRSRVSHARPRTAKNRQ